MSKFTRLSVLQAFVDTGVVPLYCKKDDEKEKIAAKVCNRRKIGWMPLRQFWYVF